MVIFLGSWRWWEIDSDEDADEFCPLLPALRPLVIGLADKATQLEMDANEGDEGGEKQLKDMQDALALEWKAQVGFWSVRNYRF